MTLFVRRGKRVVMAAMLFAALAGLGAGVSAQGMDVAVYVSGDFSVDEKTVLGTYLLTALVNSGRYTESEKSEQFLTEVYGENASGDSAITDGALCEIGRRLGINNICAATVTPTFGFYKVSASVIYTGTPDEQRRRDGYYDCIAPFQGEAVSPLKTIKDLAQVSSTLIGNMFGGNIPAAQTESEPAPVISRSAVVDAPPAEHGREAPPPPPAAPPQSAASALSLGSTIPFQDLRSQSAVAGASAGAPAGAPAATPGAAAGAAASLTGEAKAAVDKVVAAVNAFKDATNKSVEAANAVKTATQAKNFSAVMDAKKKVTAAADAVKKAKADVEEAVRALKAVGPEAEAAVKSMGIDLAMFGGGAGGGSAGGGGSAQSSGAPGFDEDEPQPAKMSSAGGAVILDLVGAGFFVYGLNREFNVRDNIEKMKWRDAKSTATQRNVAYTIGTILLLSGISIHIFF